MYVLGSFLHSINILYPWSSPWILVVYGLGFIVWIASVLAFASRMLNTSWYHALSLTSVSGLLFYAVSNPLLDLLPYQMQSVTERSMLPTLSNEHSVTFCSHCGSQTLLAGSTGPLEGHITGRETHAMPDESGICSKCFLPGRTSRHRVYTHDADEICVNKLLEPRRWDIVVFREKQFDKPLYPALRIVGMLGERVFLQDGAPWINGQRLSAPDEIKGPRFEDFATVGRSTERLTATFGTLYSLRFLGIVV
jgi:hypothetical protein